MAIYTNYARYLKAKWFKEYLSEENDTYMLFGIGNPKWDSVNNNSVQSMPVAPYNTTSLTDPTNAADNQFFDNTVQQFYISKNVIDTVNNNNNKFIHTVNNGTANTGLITQTKNFVPPFPCIWHNSESESGENLFHDGSSLSSVTKNTYQNYYIYNNTLYNITSSTSTAVNTSEINSFTNQELCYYAELCIRGRALNISAITDPSSSTFNPIIPVGLLGAVRCNIDFVKDVGFEGEHRDASGSESFMYGDRYWQLVKDSEVKNDNITEATELPHHLMFLAVVNPRNLCTELSLDQNLVPRQIAIFTRKRIGGVQGPRFFRVDENIFNFGQYQTDDLAYVTGVIIPGTDRTGSVLNFTLPHNGTAGTYTDGEFKFILHDYIRGANRSAHATDRFGYVLGF